MIRPKADRACLIIYNKGIEDLSPDELKDISFLKESSQGEMTASIGLWLAAVITFALHAGINMTVAISAGTKGSGLIGTFLGACFWPVVITALSANWNKTQKGRVKVFWVTCLVLVLLSAITFVSVGGYMDFVRSRR